MLLKSFKFIMTPLQSVKQKIIKAVSGIRFRVCPACDKHNHEVGYCECGAFLRDKWQERDINLEDVLMALNKNLYPDYCIMPSGCFFEILDITKNFDKVKSCQVWWKLNKPLHLQKQETINFLDKIL